METVLSICISTYNNKTILHNCLNEMLKYNGEEIELVIVDNCSNDKTWDYLNDIQDSRIKIYRNSENISPYQSFARALEISSGDFVTMLFDNEYILCEDLGIFINKCLEDDTESYKLRFFDVESKNQYKAMVIDRREKIAVSKDLKSNRPLLSICIPTYNRKYALLYGINRVLTYDSDDIEVVVVDNASTDGTVEWINKIHDFRLRIIKNESNYGYYYNTSKAIVSAVGKYIICINDRDSLDKRDLYQYLNYLNDNTSEVIMNNPINNIPVCVESKAYYQKKISHPGTYTFSSSMIDKIRDKFLGVNSVISILDSCSESSITDSTAWKAFWIDYNYFFDYVFIEKSGWDVYHKSLSRTPPNAKNIKVNRTVSAIDFEMFPKNYIKSGFYSSLTNAYISDDSLLEYCIGMHRGSLEFFLSTWRRIYNNRDYYIGRYEGLEYLLPRDINYKNLVDELMNELMKVLENWNRTSDELINKIYKTTNEVYSNFEE